MGGGGGGSGGLDLLTLLAFFSSVISSFLIQTKGVGRGAGPRTLLLDSPLKNDRSPRDVTGQSYPIYACTRDNYARAL